MKLSKLALAVVTVAVAVGFAQAQKQPKQHSEPAGVSAKNAATKSMTFDAQEVLRYMDGVSPIAILDIGEAESDPIVLNRSFKDALKENVDRESIERVSVGK